MPILDPAVVVETIINTYFNNLIADASTVVPVILKQFPTDYQEEAVAYLTDPAFKVTTFFQNAYIPSQLPVWNIVLAGENENAGNQQMYLNDIVVSPDDPNNDGDEQHGSDWMQKVNVFIRTQKERQCIILYALTKWIFLQNRLTFESAGFKTPIFSGSDVMYEIERKPTFVFTRMLSVSCRSLQTVDTDISDDPILKQVISGWPEEIEILDQAVLGGP